MHAALSTLQQGVESLIPWFRTDGELLDPLLLEPTQYSTPYYALCNAVLSRQLGDAGQVYRQRALLGLKAALAYVLNWQLPPRISSMERETGYAWGINHRDFFWPAILKTYLLLKEQHPQSVASLGGDIASVRVEQSFAERPPNNWASVWLSGEWLRFREGLSPYSQDQLDAWLGAYFENHIRLDLGFYMEPGLPNSYDLFTRFHLADILLNGYSGPWSEKLQALMETGLIRSLDAQLSDGSLASAHRSTGQTWTLSAQCAYFSMAAVYFKPTQPHLAARAEQAARRALTAFCHYQRPGGIFSPVENILPPQYRVGYELYTADGHYSSLALAFLGTAVQHGLGDAAPVDLAPRAPTVRIEHDPTFRAVAHHGPYSLHFNAAPAEHYDAFGIVDLSFGLNRVLQFVSSVHATGTDRFYNIGLAVRKSSGRAPLEIISHAKHDLIEPIQRGSSPASLVVRTRPRGWQHTYQFSARLESDSIFISEALEGQLSYKTLLIPYLRDFGGSFTTRVTFEPQAVLFTLGEEAVRFSFDTWLDHCLDLPHGFENRRGLCGLLRVDFRDPLETVNYQVSIVH